jgi:hypothetical protein
MCIITFNEYRECGCKEKVKRTLYNSHREECKVVEHVEKYEGRCSKYPPPKPKGKWWKWGHC